ncbi:IS630 family transposase [Gordonia sp. ABSL11-1]|uniref:IS630 family transposase n=1 Tax=Gordonia sp. ABSL11-1 TaxID=3053924 RepID=UPI0025722690|nr:IS630 family transposase [Gordonia sp. ABSL11-1]MDL9949043.1 IS630 family transposase [Gordonia sp. ABSL11-1]
MTISDADRTLLVSRVRAGSTPQRDVLRALIVLAAGDGHPNQRIAEDLGVCVDTVCKWRTRYAGKGIEGLTDLPRTGRPRVYTPTQVAVATALACQMPAESEVPLARWSAPELAAALHAEGIGASASTVRRWLVGDALTPWRYQSWLAVRDPDFEAKASRILDLYDRCYQGAPLTADEYVISADEKPSIQARDRCHRTVPTAPGHGVRVSHDYQRRGALTYLTAYDVGNAKVFGRCAGSTGIVEFTALVDQVMTQEPYASATRVFWIVDNGSSHRGQKAINRLAERYPNAVMIHTPVHASWLNQVEIYYSIIQRKVLSPNDFPDLAAVEQRLLAFEDRYNATATPFRWHYTTDDLNRHLARLDQQPAA